MPSPLDADLSPAGNPSNGNIERFGPQRVSIPGRTVTAARVGADAGHRAGDRRRRTTAVRLWPARRSRWASTMSSELRTFMVSVRFTVSAQILKPPARGAATCPSLWMSLRRRAACVVDCTSTATRARAFGASDIGSSMDVITAGPGTTLRGLTPQWPVADPTDPLLNRPTGGYVVS